MSLGQLESATVHLVRHGEVDNPRAVIYGRQPGYHLSERGHRQAEAAAARLAREDVGTVWASPLERAQETALVIAGRHHLGITTDGRLTESESSFANFGITWRAFLGSLLRSPRHWAKLANPLRPSWGESFADIRERMVAAVADAVGSAPGRGVVVVSHQTPIIVTRLALQRSKLPPWPFLGGCELGSITTLVIEAGSIASSSYFRSVT